MRVRDALHRAEQHAKDSVHESAERFKTGIRGLETSLRHKVRQRKHTDAITVRTGIVSINGCDVEKMPCNGGRRTP